MSDSPSSAMSSRALEIIDGVPQLPSPPESTMKLLGLAASSNVEIRPIVSLVESSPSLAAETLKLVNSAGAGLSQPLSSIHAAAVLLGPFQVRSLAVAASMAPMLRGAQGYFQSALGFAAIAQKLATDQAQGEEAFTAGLLADIGRLALFASSDPAVITWRKNPLFEDMDCPLEAEREAFGSDHTEIGGSLAERWKLPERLVEAIRWHHGNPEAFSPSPLTLLVQEAARRLIAGEVPEDAPKATVDEEDSQQDLSPTSLANAKAPAVSKTVLAKAR